MSDEDIELLVNLLLVFILLFILAVVAENAQEW